MNGFSMKVVILCGGKGERLMPLTKDVPKPLVPVNGKPILQHIIDLYEKKGLHEFTLCIGAHGNKIKEYFKDKPQHQVVFSESGEDASMLKRIYDARTNAGGCVMVSYADTITDIDVGDLIKFHKDKGSMATIMVAKIKSPFGLVTCDNNDKCTSFEEKPTFHYYIGHILLESQAFNHMTPELLEMEDGAGLVAFFKKLTSLGLIHVYEHKGLQTTFNTSTERDRSEEELVRFHTFKEE